MTENPTTKAKKQPLTKGFENEFGDEELNKKDGEFGKRKAMRAIIFEEKPKKDKPRMCS